MPSFDLQAVLASDSRQLSEALNTAAGAQGRTPEALREKLARAFYGDAIATPALDTQLHLLFTRLETAVVKQLIQQDAFYTDAQHPLRQHLQILLNAAWPWYSLQTKSGEQLYRRLADLIETLDEGWATTNDASTEAIEAFAQWHAGEQKRALLLEQRLCESERATHQISSAQAQVTRLINTHLAQRSLPIEFHDAISNQLKSELQYWAFNTPAEQLINLPLWQHWQKLLPALGRLFAQGEHKPDDQHLYSQIPAIIAELERSLSCPTSHAAAYQQLIEQLHQGLMLTIQKQPQELAPFTALPLPEGYSGAKTQVPLALLQATERLNPGDWILMRGDQQESIRCKLALKDAAQDQLLFVDHSGRKVMNKTNKDFALCLSTGLAKPLRIPNLQQLINQHLTPLIALANQHITQQLIQQKQKAEALVRVFMEQQQAQQEAEERERLAQQARVQAELAARRAAAQKALAEARALADAQQQRAAELAAERERAAQEQAAIAAAQSAERAQNASRLANELQVGAWLELHMQDNAPLRAKLSVIIGATGKYIFVDQVGRKLAEYNRDQLIEALTTGAAKLLRNGDNFEDQLAKVIRGLRRDVN